MSKLDSILSRLFTYATASGQAATKLPNGLHVYMIVTGGTLKLSLRRDTVFPSMLEWHTVVAHLPWQSDAKPSQAPRYTLTATIPIQTPMF